MENRVHVMKPSEDQHSVSESGVAGGFSPHSQEDKEPPQVCFKWKNAGDLPKSAETWSDDHLPIDIILLTVESCDFLSCFSLLDKPFKSYKKEIGYVYFGGIGDTSDQEKLKIALVKCRKGAATPGGSLTAVLDAVKVLRPKAVFSVGTCISLGLEKVKMGDVVISCKLTAEGFRTPVSPLLSCLIQDAPYGWVAPLQNPDEMEVKVHCDGDILSQSLREKCRCDDVFERYPGAVAIETEGEGLYAAAYDANIEWVIVKGVASYFHQSQSATSKWMSFASTMATSMVAKMLKDPTVFREWPHYNQGVWYGTSEDQHSLRQYGGVWYGTSEDQHSLRQYGGVRYGTSEDQHSLRQYGGVQYGTSEDQHSLRQYGGVQYGTSEDQHSLRQYGAIRAFNKLQKMHQDAGKLQKKADLLEDLKINASSKGFEIIDNDGGGNCMFHALCDQLKCKKDLKISHQELRKELVKYLQEHPKVSGGTELASFLDADRFPSWGEYLRKMAQDEWGDHIILSAAANWSKCNIRVISSVPSNDVTISPFHPSSDADVLELGHVVELHYVSLRRPTSGNMASSRRNPNMAIPLCLPNNCRWNATSGKCSKIGEERSSLYIVDEALQKRRALKGFALPLCLPNNCQWNKQTGEVSHSSEQRNSLYVVDEALDQLKKIKGPVCVVSIAGPCRKGKSYILSKAFDQGGVFPLGYCLDPETMGIWMWVVPEKIRDSNGQEFTVVLLDSEGIDAEIAYGSDDHCIFTLTILLASVLIYNSAGVPSRNDLDELDFIVKLRQRIHLRSTDQPGKEAQEDSKLFFKTFPYFIWLLRDVVLALPRDCSNIKDFFLKRVFQSESTSACDNAAEVAESILNFFPGFDAFKLPPPSSDPDVIWNLNREEVQSDINKSFLRGVQEFKAMLLSKLSPKRSFQDGEYVTGEALAFLVNIYVAALNTPGVVPNVQSAWETFVHTKCTEAKFAAVQVYDKAMSTHLDKCQLPCDSDNIRKMQKNAVEESMAVFQAEIVGVSALSSEKYLEELVENMEIKLKVLQERNNNLTREEGVALLKRLKEERLDPILALLATEGGSSVSFTEIIGGYSAIEEGFKSKSRGAKDVCAQMFYEFHPELQKDMQKHMAHLQQLKDYDERLALEREELARHEQERKRIEEENKRLEEERKTKEREMKLLQKKQEEDKRRLEEQFRADLEAQREQMRDMMTANMDELRSERQAIIDQNQTLQDTISSMNEAMERRNGQIQELQHQITELANRPPPPPPPKGGKCVIL